MKKSFELSVLVIVGTGRLSGVVFYVSSVMSVVQSATREVSVTLVYRMNNLYPESAEDG